MWDEVELGDQKWMVICQNRFSVLLAQKFCIAYLGQLHWANFWPTGAILVKPPLLPKYWLLPKEQVWYWGAVQRYQRPFLECSEYPQSTWLESHPSLMTPLGLDGKAAMQWNRLGRVSKSYNRVKGLFRTCLKTSLTSMPSNAIPISDTSRIDLSHGKLAEYLCHVGGLASS